MIPHVTTLIGTRQTAPNMSFDVLSRVRGRETHRYGETLLHIDVLSPHVTPNRGGRKLILDQKHKTKSASYVTFKTPRSRLGSGVLKCKKTSKRTLGRLDKTFIWGWSNDFQLYGSLFSIEPISNGIGYLLS